MAPPLIHTLSRTVGTEPTAWISPTGTGDGSEDNPAPLTDLNALIYPGAVIELTAGVYQRNQPYLITAGGATIQGPAATLRSNRANPWSPGSTDGYPFFQLGPGADGLTFTDLTFQHVGNGCVQIGAPLVNLTFQRITAWNVQRFLENRIVAGQADATIDGLTVQDVTVKDFSKGAIRLQYDTRNGLIENVTGTAVQGDDFPIGVSCVGTVHDIIMRWVRMDDCTQIRTPELYWNGDGFTSEADTHNLTFEDCSSSGCTDAGWDLKGDGHRLVRCTARDNKRNFRLWGQATLEDCIGWDPQQRGGTGTQAQVHTASNAQVEVTNGTFASCDPATITFDADGTSTLNVGSAQVTRHVDAPLSTKETNATLIWGTVTEQLCGGG